MQLPTVELFGITLHRVTFSETIAVLHEWMADRTPCRYVVTPNVDHIVKLQSNREMQEAYRGASLVIADGWPLVTASRWLGRPLPERVAGSDVVPGLFATAERTPGFRVFLCGAAPGVAEEAAQRIQARWPAVQIVGVASPPLGFETAPEQNKSLIAAINATSPHLLVVGLGAPKQEIWLNQHAAELQVSVAIAAGATIDFFAGVQKRAPKWLQRLRLEWLYRLVSNPRRLVRRYAHDAVVFPRLLVAERRRLRAEKV